MGNVTSTTQNLTNEILNSMTANCKNSRTIDQEISGLNIEADNCKNVIVSNKTTVTADCNMSQAANLLAEAYNKASTAQKSQLNLVNADNNNQDVKNIISSKLNTNCDSEQNAMQSIKNSTIKVDNCDNLKIVNDSNVQTQCVLKTMNDSLNKLDNKQENKQGGDIQDLTKEIKGHKGDIIFGAIILALIVAIVFFLIKKTDSSNSSKSSTTNNSGVEMTQMAPRSYAPQSNYSYGQSSQSYPNTQPYYQSK
ncbi:Lipid membrane protein of large eukaryotic DNA viruses [seawater metagenome]|uniref:Lipid membrane protein of large eukaryotic DNA viruses n=1 Tax=seawater metagenome TaxID=1561972 RepID=A0A5E8CLP5_9ZZZZ